MSAIKFKEAIEIIREQKCSHVKVLTLDKRRICEYSDEDSTTEGCISYLENKKSVLASYNLVNIFATTKKGADGNWTNAYNWTVKCDNNYDHNHEENNTQHHRGYVSEREAALMRELDTLKLQVQFQKQIDELNAKLEGKDDGDLFSNFDKLLPLLPLITNDSGKIEKVIQLAGVMNGGKQNSRAGIAGKNEIKMERTEEEEDLILQRIELNIKKLIKVCGSDKIDKLIQAASDKPSIVDTALNFLT